VPDYIICTADSCSGKTYRVISDQLGSVRLVVDTSNGSIMQRIDYDEWGVAQVVTDNDPRGLQSNKVYFQPFGFASGVYDGATALVRFGERDYDAASGRWTTKDRARFRGGINFYAYGQGDPANWTDRSGQSGAAVEQGLAEMLARSAVRAEAGAAVEALASAAAALRFAAVTGSMGAASIVVGVGLILMESDPDPAAGTEDGDNAEPNASEAGGVCEDPGQSKNSKRFNPEQQALIDLAKQGQRTGVTPQEADQLLQWAKETGVPARGPEVHPGRPFGQFPHIHIGPIDHIPVN
jgi:RHS repeat-associated protein